MRQLEREGSIRDRARLLTASFLVKDLGIDSRLGAATSSTSWSTGRANNVGNWRWVAGTGSPRPTASSTRSRRRTASIPTGTTSGGTFPSWLDRRVAVHAPWKLGPLERQHLDYPEPIVDHAEAAAAFLRRRRSED